MDKHNYMLLLSGCFETLVTICLKRLFVLDLSINVAIMDAHVIASSLEAILNFPVFKLKFSGSPWQR